MDTHQTWVREPATGKWRVDFFREPSDGDTWICRREPAIRLPYEQVIERTGRLAHLSTSAAAAVHILDRRLILRVQQNGQQDVETQTHTTGRAGEYSSLTPSPRRNPVFV